MGRRKKGGKPIHGWLAISKDPGMGSTRVVEQVRRITKAEKVGHGGTLDPFSEGVLPMALGEATKALGVMPPQKKRYRFWLRFGMETNTGDPTGEIERETGLVPQRSALEKAIYRFTGTIQQVPPIYSAVHVHGERAYTLARRGEKPELTPRETTIHTLELENFSEEEGIAELTVCCSRGTYIRSLARDIGREIHCGAYLQRLIRTETLGFHLDHSISLETLNAGVTEGRLEQLLFPVDCVLDDIPALRLEEAVQHKVRHGQSVWIATKEHRSGAVRLLTSDERFLGVGTLVGDINDSGRRLCRPRRLFHM